MISLGIDLGGTQIKYGLVEDGKILDCGICDTRLEEGYQAVVHRMADCAKSFLRGASTGRAGRFPPNKKPFPLNGSPFRGKGFLFFSG